MLATAAAGILFLCALLVATARGFAMAAVCVYIPAILFMSTLVPTDIPLFPDVDATAACGYALLVVALFRGHEFRSIKLNIVDYFMVALLCWSTISICATVSAWDAISFTGTSLFRWIMPYVLGRMVMQDAEARKTLFYVLCASAMFCGFIAAIEARLKPLFFSRLIEPTGLISINNTEVMYRYGLARAQVLSPHPIDLGNVGVLVGAMIIMLTPMLGKRWKQPLPLLGVMGAGMMVVGAVSFTCFFALAVCFALFYLFLQRGSGKFAVVPSMMIIILGMIVMTSVLINRTIDPDLDPDTALAGSLTMRTIIVQGVWKVEQAASMSGLLYGYDAKVPGLRIGTGSIDNAYMLFVLQRGWPYVILWAGLAIAVAWRGAAGLARVRNSTERIPLAAGLAAALAIFAAMYTVWYGFIYAQLLVFLLGMISTMTQMLQAREAAAPYANPAVNGGVGFDVVAGMQGRAWRRPAGGRPA